MTAGGLSDLMEDLVKRFMMLLVGAVLAIAGMQVSANAATVPLGDITHSTADSFGGDLGFFQPPTAFSDNVTFHLSAPQFVTGNLTDIEISFGPFNLLDITGLTATFNGNPLTLDPSGNFSLGAMLAAGDYFITIAGPTAGFFGGAYHIELTATPIPAAMLLFVSAIGGLAGFAGLRRRASAAA
jgi:hypothetical protein